MNDIELLFFEMIRLAIGNADGLSRTPSAKEWAMLYDMAEKQSVVGICFAGVKKLCNSDEEYYAGMDELQYLTWMGMAAQIQQRNQVVNKQCVALQKKLLVDGFRTSILKGQAVAPYYGPHLCVLRQSGDIDAWVDGEREQIVDYVNRTFPTDDISYLHAKYELFKDTDVELHFTPSVCSGRKQNELMQRWFEQQKEPCFSNKIRLMGGLEIVAPTVAFNTVFLLHHIFRHFLYEGIGFRQIMDYYYTLSSSPLQGEDLDKVLETIVELGLQDFAGAVMYVMREVFHIDDQVLICPVDEKRGRRLLEIIMEGGNFGHSTEKFKIPQWNKPLTRLSRYVRRNWFMLEDYPQEIVNNFFRKILRYK